jgi:hypothetical protein
MYFTQKKKVSIEKTRNLGATKDFKVHHSNSIEFCSSKGMLYFAGYGSPLILVLYYPSLKFNSKT